MSNNKQSSVEWLAEMIVKMGYVSTEILEQAKAMHNTEMKEMYLKGIENYDLTFKRKDNETFGGNNE